MSQLQRQAVCFLMHDNSTIITILSLFICAMELSFFLSSKNKAILFEFNLSYLSKQ